MHFRSLIVAFAVAFGACSSPRPTVSKIGPSESPEIARLRSDITYLASKPLAGRQAGKPGSDTAANFIARRFTELGLRPAFIETDCRANACRESFFQVFHNESMVTSNVGAVVLGADSVLRSQFVVVSAHYDHVGLTSDRNSSYMSIHPGADDNASGTAAMLELARRFAARPPQRSVLFLAFGAEELGLVGSNTFVAHPSVPLRSIYLVVNLDMVGRLRANAVTVFGVQDSTLRAFVNAANTEPKLSLTLKAASSGRSDDYPFSSRGVLAIHVTTNEHVDYHLPCDTPDRIEFDGLLRVMSFVERIARTAGGEPPR